jgi:hypothetical protein
MLNQALKIWQSGAHRDSSTTEDYYPIFFEILHQGVGNDRPVTRKLWHVARILKPCLTSIMFRLSIVEPTIRSGRD